MAHDPYRLGQRDGIDCAMCAICPHCLVLSSSRDSTNDVERDGKWRGGNIQSATHMIGDKPRRCRAAKLIPLLLMSRAMLK